MTLDIDSRDARPRFGNRNVGQQRIPGTGLAVYGTSTALDKLSDANRGRYVRGCISIETRRINARPGVSRLRVRNPRNKQRLARSGQVDGLHVWELLQSPDQLLRERLARRVICQLRRCIEIHLGNTRIHENSVDIQVDSVRKARADRGPEPLIRSFQEATHQSRRQSGTNNRDHSRIGHQNLERRVKEVQSVRTEGTIDICLR